MKIAAIDIGSNAARLQVTRIIEYNQLITFKKLEYVRFPLRLGKDVFATGGIGREKEEHFFKLMQAFKNLMDLYEVDHYYGCATSAMREAQNGQIIIQKVLKELDLPIEIISGKKEAEMINRVINLYLDHKTYLHIDVGGGSTELNLYADRKKVNSASFEIGSVRSLGFGDFTAEWQRLIRWVHQHVNANYRKVISIGTGGNINKIFEIAEGDKRRKISLDSILRVQSFLKNMSAEERLSKLQLNPDRAEVIIPASEIYIEVMLTAKAKTMLVPDVGLKDGINYLLFEKHYPSKGKVLVKN
ncbi:MAG: phosphatase [Cyclobacteriaceae bacterium]|nr:phosphatase [Cyclobacteriaceae bacterium HetDA_MAG_MS6]